MYDYILRGISMKRYIRMILKTLMQPLRKMPPARAIALMFVVLILIGSSLLCLPCASQSRQPTPFLTSLFTATSATCVTGLVLVDTGSYWSLFGQSVILVLIQIGGLGFMTIAAVFFMALRQKIGLRSRMLLAEALSSDDYSGVTSLVKNVLKGTFLAEGIGALLLTLRFWPEFGFLTALRYGVFHSISAFCNAGFDILGDLEAGGSLCRYAADPVVNLTLIFLIVAAGIGFAVWGDIFRSRRFKRLTLYSRFVLVMTAILIFGGAAGYALLEWNNPDTIGSLSSGGKILASLFESVTMRTAGFVTFDQNGLRDASKLLSDVLMFVGGSSGSTAGGVKTVTVGIVLLAAFSIARGKTRVCLGRHTIPQEDVNRALSLALLVLLFSLSAGAALCILDGFALKNTIFETMSAICTVGLTTGITASLGTASRLILIVLMFFGRVGIMTISVGFLTQDKTQERIRYADTKMMIG